MLGQKPSALFTLGIFFLLVTINIAANANDLEHQKEGIDYVAFGLNYNKFKSIELVTVENAGVNSEGEIFEDVFSRQSALKADTYAATLVWGTYVTDYFKTELRYGQGLASETLDGIAEINMSYWFNWYIGAAYPITDYANVFAQYGISIFDADFTRIQKELFIPVDLNTLQLPRIAVIQPSRLEMEEDLFGTNFSTTWLVGVDFSIAKNWYWTWEYGRLLNDDASGIKVYQLNTLLKYEF